MNEQNKLTALKACLYVRLIELSGSSKATDEYREDELKKVLALVDEVDKLGFASQQAPGMRWIKASDRLPEKDGEYHILWYDQHSEDKWVANYSKEKQFYISEEIGYLGKDQVKWLDESEPGKVVSDWISVDEKMPEPLTGCMVFIPEEDFHITSGMWDISGKWVLLDEYRVPDCKVTHWMPEPDIPKEFHAERAENNKAMKWLKGILPTPPKHSNLK